MIASKWLNGLFLPEASPVVCVSRFSQRLVFVLSATIFAALGLGIVMGEFGYFGVHASGQQSGAYRQMRVYAEVLQKVQSDYVTEPNMNEVTDGALHGLLESLDSDSSYMTPTEYKIYKEHAAADTAQVGLHISKRYGYATVVSVLPDSPADKDHLADGDVVESIDGQSTHELPLAVIRMMLEGKSGSTVQISVVRPMKPDPDKLTLTRTDVQVPLLAQQQYDNSTILYLKPLVLTAARVDDIAAQIKAAGKTRKILLDLRDCYGDDIQQGLRLANFFIQQGTLAKVEGQKYPLQTFAADPAKYLTGAPLAVLVNRGTYGAPEIAAAAIEAAKRGDVVGERTFGEGVVQKTLELPDGAALLLTVAKYETPDGKKIEDVAVAPTVTVNPPIDSEIEGTPAPKDDLILDKGLELLKAKSA